VDTIPSSTPNEVANFANTKKGGEKKEEEELTVPSRTNRTRTDRFTGGSQRVSAKQRDSAQSEKNIQKGGISTRKRANSKKKHETHLTE